VDAADGNHVRPSVVPPCPIPPGHPIRIKPSWMNSIWFASGPLDDRRTREAVRHRSPLGPRPAGARGADHRSCRGIPRQPDRRPGNAISRGLCPQGAISGVRRPRSHEYNPGHSDMEIVGLRHRSHFDLIRRASRAVSIARCPGREYDPLRRRYAQARQAHLYGTGADLAIAASLQL